MLLLATLGCRRRPEALGSEVHLLETGIVGASGFVERQAIHGDDRRSLKLTPPSMARFRARVPDRAWLAFGLVARPVDVPLRLSIEAAGTIVHEEHSRSAAGWSERRVSLAAFAGREVEFRVHVAGALDMVALGEPKLLAPRPAPDNVLVYVVDCLRADRVGAMGYTRGTTPRIDRLASESFVFERAYACSAWTKPSVGCLFTGLYSVRHGARSADQALDPERRTLAEALRGQGYATAAVIANPVLDGRGFGFARGFDNYVELAREWKGRAVNSTPADAAQVTDASLRWLQANHDRPFFLSVHSIDLHYPYLKRAGFEALVREDRSGLERDSDLYDSELAYNDREFGRLLDGLDRLGLSDRTTLLVTADHGEEFGERGYSRHGHTLFDTLLHVPLVLKPAGTRRGRRVAQAVANVDILPTLLDLLGAPAPAGLDGISVRGLLHGRLLVERPLFAEQVSGNTAVYAVRQGRFKLIHELIPEPRQLLFDLENDPGELLDVRDRHPLEAAWRAEILDPFLGQGQEGLHLLLADPPAGHTLRLELTTAARVTEVLRLTRRTGDTLEISPDARRVRLAFVAAGAQRHLVIRTEPAGAPLNLDFGNALAPEDLRLGERALPASALPALLLPRELRVAKAPPVARLPGRAWAFALLPNVGPKQLRPELLEQMRALGYVQ